MMRPHFCRRMKGRTARVARTADIRLRFRMSSQSWSVVEAGELADPSRVVDQHMNGAPALANLVHQAANVVGLRHVGSDADHFRAGALADLLRRPLQFFLTAGADGHARSLRRKCLRDGFADPFARARHQHNLVLQS